MADNEQINWPEPAKLGDPISDYRFYPSDLGNEYQQYVDDRQGDVITQEVPS